MKVSNRFLIILVVFLTHTVSGFSQETFPVNGIHAKDVVPVVIQNATVVISSKTKLEKASLLIEKGRITAIGQQVSIPAGALIIDGSGKTIYPGFIDLYSSYGIGKVKSSGNHDEDYNGPATNNPKGALGWNNAIHAEFDASLGIEPQSDEAGAYRKGGFTTVCAHRIDGIVRGTGCVVDLGNEMHSNLVLPRAAAFYSFNKGSSTSEYPSSIMGSIALLRQTFCDAAWYKNGGSKTEANLSLEAFNTIQSLPQFFDANDKWNVLRADAVGDEFGVHYILKGNGTEYQRLQEMKATNATLVVPVNFPQAFDVSDPSLARLVSYSEMKHWEMAPFNLRLLYENKIPFCITSAGLDDKSEFLNNVRKAVKYGLPEAAALEALTALPASLMHVDKEVGGLFVGARANFFIADGNVFNEGTAILESWVDGERFEVQSPKASKKEGEYTLVVGGKKLPAVAVKKEKDNWIGSAKLPKETFVAFLPNATKDSLTYQLKFQDDGEFIYGEIALDSSFIPVFFTARLFKSENGIQISGVTASPNMSGQILSGTFTPKAKEEEEKKKSEPTPIPSPILFPFTAYGRLELPKQENVVYRNATLWTCDKGVLQEGDLWIKNGKIAGVGKDLVLPKGETINEIDATGKHISPGIIDEHSHIALASVNEGTQASSAEVKEESVIYPEDIDIYRQLAGGTTASQLLHGSANPIGGQSALIKLRWGANAEGMKISNAPKFIKFALGENVKQSNWGDHSTTRFPQTRMGVEQVYFDHFIRAKEYEAAWKNYNTQLANKKAPVKPVAPRRDLELEAILEIINKERFITCHSYVQSEINMLMHVADSFNFKINTFTHILEGYKVADKMAAHGAGASTFSDWWAYKAEVKDAIPYNAAILYEQGITVAINSDDAEMGSRLNQEAAKTVKYGNVPPEEALKMVTLNPAKLLHLDQRMGSLTVGKDADFVVWSAEPLSIYARAEKTYIDGACYYNASLDEQIHKQQEEDRERIRQKMLEAKNNGAPTRTPSRKPPHHFHCDTMDQTSQGIIIKE